jgi:ribose transport system substrate-binding protein
MQRWRAALAAGMLTCALAACGSDDEPGASASAGGTGSDEPIKVAAFGFSANSYFAASLKEVKRVIEAAGGTVQTFDTNFDAAKQFRQVQDATASGKFDAFIISPLDGVGIAPAVKQAVEKDIKVVAMSSVVGPRQDTTKVQVPGMAGAILDPPAMRGRWLGGIVAKACEGLSSCKVAWEVGNAQLPIEQLFISEAEKVMAKTPGIESVATVSTGLQAGPAAKATADVLQAHPDLNVIAASGDQAIVGAALAVKQRGKHAGSGAGEIRLVGLGASKSSVEGIRGGDWFGTVLSLPADEGRIAAETVIKAVRDGVTTPVEMSATEKSGLTPEMTKGDLPQDFQAQWAG